MSDANTATLPVLLSALRLPSIARHWTRHAETADREGWPAVRLLATLFELEIADRTARHIQPGQSLESYPAA